MKYTILTFLFALANTALAAPVPVGTHNDGHIIDAMALPEKGEGYVHMYHEDNRYWGTLQMVSMLQKAAADISKKHPARDRMQVEDISAEHGGDIDGHASHEIGLDADVGYFKTNNIEHDPISTGEKYAPKMVINGKISKNFDLQRNWELVKAFHRHGDVQKIFVDVTIKKELCKYSRKINEYSNNIEVLRSLRHQDNHQDHLHVRLRCPKDAKKCKNQAEAPEGSGCQ